MPNSNEHFSRYSDDDFHLVFSSHYSLVIGEPPKETVFLPAGSPCTLYDDSSEIAVAMCRFAGFYFLVGLIISWAQSTPGSKVICRLELTHVCTDLCNQ